MVVPENDGCRAALMVTRRYASKIAEGTLAPYEGARQIAAELGECYEFLGQDMELVDLLAGIAGLADEYEENQVDATLTKELESDIVEKALEFMRLAAAAGLD